MLCLRRLGTARSGSWPPLGRHLRSLSPGIRCDPGTSASFSPSARHAAPKLGAFAVAVASVRSVLRPDFPQLPHLGCYLPTHSVPVPAQPNVPERKLTTAHDPWSQAGPGWPVSAASWTSPGPSSSSSPPPHSQLTACLSPAVMDCPCSRWRPTLHSKA